MKFWYNTIHLSIVNINKNGREKKKQRNYKNCEKPDEPSLSYMYLERYQTYFDFNPVCVSKIDC